MFFKHPPVFSILPVLMLLPSPVWATQTHADAEGLIAHQTGHFLFIFGMGYLLFRLYRIEHKKTGWAEFKIFLLLTTLWNVLTFSGHWLNEFIPPEKFIKAGSRTVSFEIDSIIDILYYLSKLDHLILVPALLFLLLALQKWNTQQ